MPLRRQEKRERLAVELRESLEVDGIDAPLAEFTFRHEGLRSPERFRDLDLRQPGLVTRLTKTLEKVLVVRAVDGAAAARAVLHKCGAHCTLFRDTPS